MKALPTEARARVIPWSAASVSGFAKCSDASGRSVGEADLTFASSGRRQYFLSTAYMQDIALIDHDM
jgi:hypothetical protein